MDKSDILVDFLVIPSNEPKYLVVCDASYWGRIKNKTTIIEVTTPGAKEPITHYYKQEKVQILNSFNLGVSYDSKKSVELPDGIYKLTVKGSPDTYNKTRTYLKTDKLRLRLYKMYTDLSLNISDWDDEYKKLLQTIEMVITQAEAFGANGENKKANSAYKQAKKLLDKYECPEC